MEVDMTKVCRVGWQAADPEKSRCCSSSLSAGRTFPIQREVASWEKWPFRRVTDVTRMWCLTMLKQFHPNPAVWPRTAALPRGCTIIPTLQTGYLGIRNVKLPKVTEPGLKQFCLHMPWSFYHATRLSPNKRHGAQPLGSVYSLGSMYPSIVSWQCSLCNNCPGRRKARSCWNDHFMGTSVNTTARSLPSLCWARTHCVEERDLVSVCKKDPLWPGPRRALSQT